MKRIRTGLFGGTFNPIHVGHIGLASAILKAARLSEVWLMVTPQNPFKVSHQLLDDNLRLEMVEKALENHPRLIASDYEFRLPKPSFTWRTLQALNEDYPDRRFVLLIGADNWLSFDRWAEPEKILEACQIVIYPREGYPVDEAALPRNVRLLNTPYFHVSSTEIRQRMQEGRPIEGLVPSEIEEMVCKAYRK
ncbi:MAG: nicotinate-nucleotide adenylyltransferase [Prevotella sp.]|nr:nicotinate-nucleotide adenylyltransferase [Prevotella sp.]